MTEEEAKTKWCPMARPNIISQRIDGKETQKELCIASECMMWESWEFEQLGEDRKPFTRNKEEGDCGLKTKHLECNA